jgi:cytoskeletal protein CcmA (bactofilin family)
MLWDKKSKVPGGVSPSEPEPLGSAVKPISAPAPAAKPETLRMEKPMADNTPRTVPSPVGSQAASVIGRSMNLKGELSGKEDLVVEGQFEGTIDVAEHTVTVGAQGQVKSEIRARHVVVHGSVTGKVTAREKIDIRRTGNVVGDLVSAGVAIEDGAYFKGSIEILREGHAETARQHAVVAAS